MLAEAPVALLLPLPGGRIHAKTEESVFARDTMEMKSKNPAVRANKR